MACLTVLLVLNSWLGEGQAATRSGQGELPDIVFIIADDLGWADVGYHDSKIRTPHLDRLAREGVRMEHYYVAPTCSPTRVSLMTGKYASRLGVLAPAYGRIFDERTQTLPGVLRQAGYRTSLVGKWHMGSPPDSTPLRSGFDSSYGYFHGQIDPLTHLYKTGVRSWHRNDTLEDEEGHATDLITREAVRILSSPDPTPVFLVVAYSVPHHPLKEPEQWVREYQNFESESRRWFAASVSHMDAGIGSICEALERSGRKENTLLVFMSDNGGQERWVSAVEYGGDYAGLPHAVLGDNRPLRGWKEDLYEGGIRVPAVVNWPARLKAGVSRQVIHVVDWMPTICRLAGIPAAGGWDGIDVLPALERVSAAVPRTLYWKTPSATAVREGAWKLVIPKVEAAPEVFNLDRDPLESRNLASEEPEALESLLRRLDQLRKGDALPGGAHGVLSADPGSARPQ